MDLEPLPVKFSKPVAVGLIEAVIREIATEFPVFDGTTFTEAERFAGYLAGQAIAWLEAGGGPGAPIFRATRSREMARAYPKVIGPIREVRVTLAELRLHALAVGG